MATKAKKLSTYKQDDKNVNKGTDRGQAMLERSIADNGLGRSILVSSDNVIIGGNKTQQQAIKRGDVKVIEIETTGNELVVVKRKDIKSGTKKFHELAIADNSVSRFNYSEDAEVVEAITADFDIDTEFYGVGEEAGDTVSDIKVNPASLLSIKEKHGVYQNATIKQIVLYYPTAQYEKLLNDLIKIQEAANLEDNSDAVQLLVNFYKKNNPKKK